MDGILCSSPEECRKSAPRIAPDDISAHAQHVLTEAQKMLRHIEPDFTASLESLLLERSVTHLDPGTYADLIYPNGDTIVMPIRYAFGELQAKIGVSHPLIEIVDSTIEDGTTISGDPLYAFERWLQAHVPAGYVYNTQWQYDEDPYERLAIELFDSAEFLDMRQPNMHLAFTDPKDMATYLATKLLSLIEVRMESRKQKIDALAHNLDQLSEIARETKIIVETLEDTALLAGENNGEYDAVRLTYNHSAHIVSAFIDVAHIVIPDFDMFKKYSFGPYVEALEKGMKEQVEAVCRNM